MDGTVVLLGGCVVAVVTVLARAAVDIARIRAEAGERIRAEAGERPKRR
ncbi:hypothetical protein ACH4Q7_22585 [Streptomyces roseolus]